MAHSPTTREQFIDRVRQALGKTYEPGHVPAPPKVDDAIVRLCRDDEDLAERFCTRAAGTGMEVRRTDGFGLGAAIAGVLGELGVGRITLNIERLEHHEAIADHLRRQGIDLVAWRGDRAMSHSYDVGAGVTDVAGAIAETGSLVMSVDADHSRSHLLVPPVHVAVVRRGDLVADLLDVTRQMTGGVAADRPSHRVVITGPSKTADIEGVLVTGVHGPGKVVVLFVEDQ